MGLGFPANGSWPVPRGVDAHRDPRSDAVEMRAGAEDGTARRTSRGISPKQYLQIYRLNRVQRRLQHSQGNATTVAGEAKAWGFWHMGQFSRDYRRMFGELPSETLARGR